MLYFVLPKVLATVWERAAHSVNRMFSLFCLFAALVVSHFGFDRRDLGSDCIISWSLLSF